MTSTTTTPLLLLQVLVLVLLLGSAISDRTVDDQEALRILRERIDQNPYQFLCQGQEIRPPALLAYLYCTYHYGSWFSVIAPFRVEVLNLVPFVAIFHDIISDGEITALQRLGDSHIQVSGYKNETDLLPTFYANHQTYELQDWDHVVVRRLSERIQDVTGLDTETAEDLKIIYNEIGSYVVREVDYLETADQLRRHSWAGNRIASVLLHLSDVEEGGRLIFPLLKISVLPVKGTAVFWYNLKHTGATDMAVTYSYCPLTAGTKWTAKKYLHQRGQEFRRPCELTP